MTTESLPTTNAEDLKSMANDLISENSTHREVIETVIASLEQNNSAMVHQTEKGYVWKFQYGTVEVFIQLTGESDEDTLAVWSSVVKLPVQDELGLMRKLLQMNWAETFEARFGLMNDQIVVVSQRTVADLSPGEVSRVVTLVATIADDNNEVLNSTFGGSK